MKFKLHPALRTPGFYSFKNNSNLQVHYNADFIREKAFGCWPNILEALGINPAYLKNKHGPCPLCGEGKDRFRFDDKGKGLYICNQCGAGDGFKLLQQYHSWDFGTALTHAAQALRLQSDRASLQPSNNLQKSVVEHAKLTNEDTYQRQTYLNHIWKSAKPIATGDPVDCYLEARGIKLKAFPTALRHHSHLPYYDENIICRGYFSAMLGLVQDKTGLAVTIHRTYLDNTCKAKVPKPKKLMRPLLKGATQGAAIRLFKPANGVLALAEGIETALAFNIATQIPTWATISAWGMEEIILPPSVNDVVIAVDNDASGRGQEAASTLSQRLLSEGRKVKRIIPSKEGTDFADMLMEVK